MIGGNYITASLIDPLNSLTWCPYRNVEYTFRDDEEGEVRRTPRGPIRDDVLASGIRGGIFCTMLYGDVPLGTRVDSFFLPDDERDT